MPDDNQDNNDKPNEATSKKLDENVTTVNSQHSGKKDDNDKNNADEVGADVVGDLREQTRLAPKCFWCPNHHATICYITKIPKSDIWCDICKKLMEGGVPMFGCTFCNWDICMECANATEPKTIDAKDNVPLRTSQRTITTKPSAKINNLVNNTDLEMLGVSVHWLMTGFTMEVQAAGFGPSAKVYDIEPTVIRGKGQDIACPMDGRKGSSYVHALLAMEDRDVVGPAQFMLSYGWGYEVKDIVDTLADYCSSNKLDPASTFIWMCCLCNNQHRVEENKSQGNTIPFEEFKHTFYSHVTGIKHVLAMMTPWYKPLYLTRIWCIFELYTAHHHEDCNLVIIMPPKEKEALKQDLWGAEGKGISALYEALAATKIQNAKASMEFDRLAILKLIEDSAQTYEMLNHSVNDLLRAWVVQVVTSLAAEWNNEAESSQSTQAATTFHNAGRILYQLGDLDNALVHYRKALAIREAVLGKNHIDIASSYNNIGGVLDEQGNYDAALVEYRKALVINKAVVGEDHPGIATSYNNIGSILLNKGDYPGSLVEYRKALAIYEAVLGKDHPYTATAYNNIASVLCDQGNFEDALIEYRKALTIDEKVLGKNHPDTASSYSNIGSVLADQGNYDDALLEYRKALQIQEAVLGKDHLDAATSNSLIGGILEIQGDYGGALVEHRKALVVREAVLGKDHPDTASSYNNIGSVLENLGNYDDALVEYKKALTIRETVLGKEHPEIASSFNNIATVLAHQGNYDDALIEYRKALTIQQAVFGKKHPYIATSHNNIGGVLANQGIFKDALVEYRKALAIREVVLGKDHPDTATTCSSIDRVLFEQGGST